MEIIAGGSATYIGVSILKILNWVPLILTVMIPFAVASMLNAGLAMSCVASLVTLIIVTLMIESRDGFFGCITTAIKTIINFFLS